MEPEGTPARQSRVAQVIPGIAFVLIVGTGLVLFLLHQNAERTRVRQAEEVNLSAGLPADYPAEVVPLYAGAEVLNSESGTSESTDGRPMKKWTIKAQTVEQDRQKIFDFYQEYLLSRGMSQSMLISIPTGYGADYADEFQTVHIVIEQRGEDPKTQLEITLQQIFE